MAKIIRCYLPDGVHRFEPFTVADYRDFLLIRNEIQTKPSEKSKIIDELLEEYYGDYPVEYRGYIFLLVLTSSTGKSKIPVSFECPVCGKSKRHLFNLEQAPLKLPTIETAGIKLTFRFPQVVSDDYGQLFLDTITTVEDSEGVYAWDSLSEDNKQSVIDAITYDDFETLITRLHPLYFTLKTRCCEEHKMVYDNFIDIFNLLLNPDEVFTFYQINHMLAKSNYSIGDIMNMIPLERNIALSLVERDSKK
ncbi:baseplate protein [Yersinia phage MHG19]|nr:baseplate protein [Yersinia phage MHG19]